MRYRRGRTGRKRRSFGKSFRRTRVGSRRKSKRLNTYRVSRGGIRL